MKDEAIGWEARAIVAAIESTKIKFYLPTAEVLSAFGREVIFNDEGEPFAAYDGETIPLKSALERWSFDNKSPNLLDSRTLPKQGAPGGRTGVLAKSSFKDLAEKSAWITKHGLAAFERLPLTAPQSSEILTQQDYRKLSLQEKARLIAKDPDYFSKLPKAPRTDGILQERGTYANVAAIERLRKIRSSGS